MNNPNRINNLKKLRDQTLNILNDTLYKIEMMEGYQHNSYSTKLINAIGTADAFKEDQK